MQPAGGEMMSPIPPPRVRSADGSPERIEVGAPLGPRGPHLKPPRVFLKIFFPPRKAAFPAEEGESTDGCTGHRGETLIGVSLRRGDSEPATPCRRGQRVTYLTKGCSASFWARTFLKRGRLRRWVHGDCQNSFRPDHDPDPGGFVSQRDRTRQRGRGRVA